MPQSQNGERKKTSAGKGILAGFGILLVSVGIFLTAFGLSFKVMMLPSSSGRNTGSEIERLKTENSELQLENMRLKEQNKILMGDDSSDED